MNDPTYDLAAAEIEAALTAPDRATALAALRRATAALAVLAADPQRHNIHRGSQLLRLLQQARLMAPGAGHE
jgi:hypothetical protein